MTIKERTGFTIVELLIVIVVIAVLASISVVAYSGVQTRAQITSVGDGLKKVDKSFRLWAIHEGFSEWPIEQTYSGGTKLSSMIDDNPGLEKYLQNVPDVIGVGTEEWFYDNDEIDSGSSVCGNAYNGTNIVIRYITDEKLVRGIDELIDDGNIGCGKVKWVIDPGILFYSLSYDKKVY